MAWWRRDPSLWARSPAHRYAQRILRDHEAALRTRCFSRTPSNTAQHQDHGSTSRPDGMTDQEWAQLQKYRRWRQILREHPYKGLFGASEDMLRGKGLTDWEWVYKTFPKWMLKEMDPQQSVSETKSVNNSDYGRRYGNRSERSSQVAEDCSTERKPSCAQPVMKATHYERDEFGIVSPSDLRRPKEASHAKVVGILEKQEPTETGGTANTREEHPMVEYEVSRLDGGQDGTAQAQFPDAPVKSEGTNTVASKASKRESSFIDAFFADEPRVRDRDLGDSKSWRQTALQRRATSNVVMRPRAGSYQVTNKDAPATKMTSASVRETFVIPSSQAQVDNYLYPRSSVATNTMAIQQKPQLPVREIQWAVPDPTELMHEAGKAEVESSSASSTSAKLGSLPEDDIDFLSAGEIRAAMGRRKSSVKSSEERIQDRQKLETGYAIAGPKALDDAVEGHVLNNYHVRRMLQEYERAQAVPKQPESDNIEAEQGALLQSKPVQMESSIDRMRRWIEEGGTSLAKHFWQDPIEAGAPSEPDMQFAKQMAGLGKSRRAREHISDDLENDLPMSKVLLERLRTDENKIEHAVYLLRTPRKAVHGAGISKNLQTIRERRLRNTYERTEKQFEAACQALRDLDVEVIEKATNAFKRRLGIASRVLHKNHTLTRMLTWSVQARLDEPNLERSKAELYSEILTRLATLRDTQLALARLMDHAVQTYGVSLKPADEALSRPVCKSEIDAATSIANEDTAAVNKAGAKFLAVTAAAVRLNDEIESEKAAMKGLSDDGYARAPMQTARKLFEDQSPLTHSLFRPFSLQFESLGKKTEGEAAENKLKEAFKQKMGDRKLVQEVRSAYEDVHGPITVEHCEVPRHGESASAKTEVKAFEMPKEDAVSQPATVFHEEIEPTETKAVGELSIIMTGLESTATTVASEGAIVKPSTPSTVVEEEVARETTQRMPPSNQEMATATSPATTETATHNASTINISTYYTILVHDPQTDALSITTSTSGPPRDTSPTLPIHQALSSLKAPARFIPHISPGLEIITANRHMLVLRDALDGRSSTRGFETVSAQPCAEAAVELPSSEVNPIDGTTRLSPTGYSGVEHSREQVDRDFEERRQAAATTEAARSKRSKHQTRDEELLKKKRGGVGGVFKTAIWASAVCYIVGVTAEVLR
ncbi:uncharacterized protein M421DRAFT_422739 [Didymella exigua CBS 183.55]|uniref:Uncharacterized protein n=1 Tax=Didymella exigua CBS 183.55 TaxID=1150837 RepID=A0A6A5RDR6_9PLEO|nr:uncharacterized protein M421DRAFT_422739 [Didymella exigua CBS 183.55]KAF1926405.1 hypothetical protein M421DRAFT_422739 [Didymella exigua CBS 183.55]